VFIHDQFWIWVYVQMPCSYIHIQRVLHAAMSLLPQAKPQTLYTQILNYNPPKHYNSTDSCLQYLGVVLGMGCEIEGHCFEFWSLGAVLGKWMVWWLRAVGGARL